MENYRPEENYPVKKSRKAPKAGLAILVILLLLAAAFVFFKPVYLMKGLGQQEMGVKIRAGEIVDIVGPGGIYNDFGLYVKLENVFPSACLMMKSSPRTCSLCMSRSAARSSARL